MSVAAGVPVGVCRVAMHRVYLRRDLMYGRNGLGFIAVSLRRSFAIDDLVIRSLPLLGFMTGMPGFGRLTM